MTTKRFTIDYSNEYAMGVGFFDNGKRITIDKMVEYLNELHEETQKKQKLLHLSANKIENLLEENEQLRHDATILIQANQDYRKENERLRRCINEIYTIARLEEVD